MTADERPAMDGEPSVPHGDPAPRRAGPPAPRHILLVEDNPIDARITQRALETAAAGEDWTVRWVSHLGEVPAAGETGPVDLVLLDLSLPDSFGMATLRGLRERLPDVPVVLLTALDPAEIEEHALAAGAQDFLAKDEITPRTLRRAIRYAIERHRMTEELTRLSVRDALTGLLNRRGFGAAAGQYVETARRLGQHYFVICADLDGLKAVNDTFGHAAGDAAIVDAATALRRTFRACDVIGRMGGDEFAVLVTNADPESVPIVLARLEQWQRQTNESAGRSYTVTMSVGVAVAEPGGPSLEGLLAAADEAAYAAKRRRKGMAG